MGGEGPREFDETGLVGNGEKRPADGLQVDGRVTLGVGDALNIHFPILGHPNWDEGSCMGVCGRVSWRVRAALRSGDRVR